MKLMLFSTEKSLLFHVVMSYNFSLSFLFKYLKSLKSFHNQKPISIFVLIALNIILYDDFNCTKPHSGRPNRFRDIKKIAL